MNPLMELRNFLLEGFELGERVGACSPSGAEDQPRPREDD
jgi:hypothetical protein